MGRRLFFLLFCWLSFNSTLLAQDISRLAPTILAQQAAVDSTGMAKPASHPPEPIAKEENTAQISKKDLITWSLALCAVLIPLTSLVFVVYFARKKKEAEIKAEHEFKKRTELEERQRKVEEQLALLTAGRQFEKKQEQEVKAEKAKTAEERYRATLENEVCLIHLTAPGAEGIPVSLLDTFVRLNISEHYRGEEVPQLGELARARGDHEDLSPEEVMQRAFQNDRRKLLLIIGDPGSGKTTLLKYYAACCLQAEGYRGLGFARPIFPFYLPLRETDPAKSLAENLAHWANKHDARIPPEELDAWLGERDTLVLLDGLDEISKLDDRKKACTWIDNKCAGLKRARFVFTSRSTGMRGADNLVLRTPHLHAEVRDFSHEQKQEFLRKWFRAAHLEGSRPRKDESADDWKERQLREAKKSAEEVIDYLDQKENRSLRELAGIPMLLQLLALIWKQYKTKPESRTKLYDVALDYLLEYRDDQRGLAPLLKADKARRVLCPAALWMQEEFGAEEVAKEKLHGYIRPILEPIKNDLTAETLCENLRDRAGLIADYGRNEYIFRHKSFREYFAGLQLAANYHENGRLARLAKTFGDNTWAEPLRYFMSRADRKAFNAFITALFNSPTSRELSQLQQDLLQSLVREAAEKPLDALLACLHDETKNETQQRYALDCLKTIAGERVRAALMDFTQKNSGKTGILLYAAEIAAQLSAPVSVQAVQPAQRKLFVELPESFRNPVEYNAEYILIRGGTIKYSVTKQIEKVPDLYFAKYLVTNKQYRRFILYLQGEEAPKVFSEKLLEFAASEKAYLDYLGDAKAWPEKLKSTYDDDRKFNGEDQPVVGVSWYAARAYCLWLSELQRENGKEQKETSVFRLPTEIEWERAAAGRQEDGPLREYPWPKEKGKPNEKLANYDGKVGQTTPVGRYPEGATPEGLMDMAGNVWEWQENWYGDKEKSRRALRGGSWVDVGDYLRCASRGGDVSVSRINFAGFRVVRAQSSFDTLKL